MQVLLFYLWEAKPQLSIIMPPPEDGELSNLVNVYIVLGYAHWGLNLGQLHGYALSQPRDHNPIDIHIHHCYLNIFSRVYWKLVRSLQV